MEVISVYVDSEKKERIRIINIIEAYVYLVNIDMDTSMPKKEQLRTIEDEIDGEKQMYITRLLTSIPS